MGRGRWRGQGGRSEAGDIPDLKVNVGLIRREAGGAQAGQADALLQEAAGGRHEAGQCQGDAQKRGGAMPVIPEHTCGQKVLAPARGTPACPGPSPPTPTTPGAALTLPGAQLHRQHGRPGELLAPTLVPADGRTQLPLQLAQVLRSKTWVWKGWSDVQGIPRWPGKEGSLGSRSLTRGRWGVEVGCKAVDVAADRDPLVSDPEGAEDGNRALGWRGCPRQGPRGGWERGGNTG